MKDWLDSGKYLPRFMRDFHDQKLLFKWLVWGCVGKAKAKGGDVPEVGWVSAHIFTIDFFLWLMAKHGWTLQRAPKSDQREYADIKETLATYGAELSRQEAAGLRAMFDGTARTATDGAES